MTRYVYDKITGRVVPMTEAVRSVAGPYIMPDLPAYRSPLGTGVIEGRRQRREDLARGECREIDPSERIDGTPKSAAKLAEEKAYLKAREGQGSFDRAVAERLMRGN